MRAVISEQPGDMRLAEVPEPIPGPGELVVRVEAALTCGTDLKTLRRGHPKIPFPMTLGHEFAGVVSSVGSGVSFHVGQKVVAAVSGPCGACLDCLAGFPNRCPTAFDRPVWGAFAESVLIPPRGVESGLFVLPDGLSFTAAALLDPLASVVRGISRIPPTRGKTVLVLGAGPIALLFVALLKRAHTSRVLVVARRRSRLDTIAAHGAEVFELPSGPSEPGSIQGNAEGEVREALLAATGGRGPGIVIDTTGDPGVLSFAVEVCGAGGTVLVFAGLPKHATLSVSATRVHYDEVSLVGSFHYTREEARTALELLSANGVPVDALITVERPLEEFAVAFEEMGKGIGMKTALLPGMRAVRA